MQTYKQTYKHENLCSSIVEETFRINTEFLCSPSRRGETKELKYHEIRRIRDTFPRSSEDIIKEIRSGFIEVMPLRMGFKLYIEIHLVSRREKAFQIVEMASSLNSFLPTM